MEGLLQAAGDALRRLGRSEQSWRSSSTGPGGLCVIVHAQNCTGLIMAAIAERDESGVAEIGLVSCKAELRLFNREAAIVSVPGGWRQSANVGFHQRLSRCCEPG